MQERLPYRLILILENIAYGAASYQVRIDGRAWELTEEEPILAINTTVGTHTIEVAGGWSLRRSVSFSVPPDQNVTRIFLRPTASNINIDIEAGARMRPYRDVTDREEGEIQPVAAPAPAPPRRGIGAAWLAFMFLLGLVCGLLLSLAIWPARARASSAGPAQTLESPELSDAPDGGDYAIEILDVRRTTDTAGNPAVVVTYVWTNNSGGTVNAAELFQAKAFQAGVQLDPAEIYDIGLYDPTAYTRELRPDAATELQSAFRLTSERVPIEFEVTPLPGVSGEAVLEEFAPSELE